MIQKYHKMKNELSDNEGEQLAIFREVSLQHGIIKTRHLLACMIYS